MIRQFIYKLRKLFRKNFSYIEIKAYLGLINAEAIYRVQAHTPNKEQNEELEEFFYTVTNSDLSTIISWTHNFTEKHFDHIVKRKQERLHALQYDMAFLTLDEWLKLQQYLLDLDTEWLVATNQYIKDLLYKSHSGMIEKSMTLPNAYEIIEPSLSDDDFIN